MLTMIIIDYFSYYRTIKYISDFLKLSNYSELSFVVLDNSVDELNFKKMIMGLENHFGIILKNINYEFEVFSSKIEKEYDIYCINPKENLGFAKGNNLAYKFAKIFCNPEYILFSNNDIQMSSDIFDMKKLIHSFTIDSKIGLIGPKVIGVNGERQSPCMKMSLVKRWWLKQLIFPFNAFHKKIKKIDSDVIELNQSQFVYRIIGAFMLFKQKVFEDIGGFDNNTFLYAEEPIIAEKLLNKGYKTYYQNDVQIVHEEGGTTKSNNYVSDKVIKEKRVYKSEMYYFKVYRKESRFALKLTDIIFRFYIIKLNLIKQILQQARKRRI